MDVALPPPCTILSFLQSVISCRLRQMCVEIVMGFLQDPSRAEVVAGYFLPDVAVVSDIEGQEPLNYDAVISRSAAALMSVEDYIGALYSLPCFEVVAHLSRNPQLG